METAALRGIPLLDAVIAHIEAEPQAWKQETYRCKTGMCVAGHAAQMAGGEWLVPELGDGDGIISDALLAEPGDDDDCVYVWNGTRVIDSDRRAMRVLELTEEQADALFEGGNSLSDIRRARDRIAGAA